MATFILIHGAMHGGWCWEEIVPRLEAAGHRAIAPNLPGMGGDPTPLEGIDLTSYADFTETLVRAQPEPVVLVGHSLGGLTISQTGERASDNVLGLVYLAAMLAPAGERPPVPGTQSTREALGRDTGVQTLPVVPEEVAIGLFYNATDAETAKRAVARLTPQPVAPMNQPLATTDARYGRLPRAYIECALDAAISLEGQRQMQVALPCDPVITLQTDHSPFFSAPDALTRALIDAAEAFAARR